MRSYTRCLNPDGAPDVAVDRSMPIVVFSEFTNAVHGPHRSRCDLILDDSAELSSSSMKSEDASLTSLQSSSRLLNNLTSREIILPITALMRATKLYSKPARQSTQRHARGPSSPLTTNASIRYNWMQ